MPLADWRDADYLNGNPDDATGPYDPAALRTAINCGEGFDWFYASDADRRTRERTPISDGAEGKPWVFRYKDLVSWWSTPHFDRVAGVEVRTDRLDARAKSRSGSPSSVARRWIRGRTSRTSSPIRSRARALRRYFSSGGRNDFAPRRFLEAHSTHWDPASASFDAADNPVSPVYGGRMLDHRRSYVWCWDARPFPAFPLEADVWTDGANWHLGHWLNGRLRGLDLGSLINAILADHDLPAARVSEADGTLQGYVIDEPGAARSAIEPLVDLFDLAVMEGPAGLTFRSVRARSADPVAIEAMVAEEDGASIEKARRARS